MAPEISARWVRNGLMGVASLSLVACANMAGIESKAKPLDAASLNLTGSETAALQAQWWRAYQDPQLNALVDKALAQAPSLKLAQARIDRAQAGSDTVASADGPHVNASLEATHQRFTAKSIYPPPFGGGIYDSGTLQLAGSWELDFFGKNRAALDASLGTVRAAQADAQAARVLLAANVVRAYGQLAHLNELSKVAQRTLAQRGEMLALVSSRVKAGLDTQLELRSAEAGLPEVRAQLEALQEQITLTQNAIQALIGEPNKPISLVLPDYVALKNVANANPLPAAIPSDLLGRRADIIAARWRVEAATQDVQSARAQFYPSVNLMAFAGLSSIGLNNLLNADATQWGVGPAVHLPLFDAGRLRAGLRGKTADLDAAIEGYNATVVEAVHEVADQLATSQSIVRQREQQRLALATAESAYDIAKRRYEAGVSTWLQVLASESAVLVQRRAGVDLTARSVDNRIALIRTLGGGYAPDVAAGATPANP